MLFLIKLQDMEELRNQFNKNELQVYFNQIKGEIIEIELGELYCNLTLKIGQNNSRIVNLVAKNPLFTQLIKGFEIGDKVLAKYYITSHKKHDRYYTTATLLDLIKNTRFNADR